MRKEMNSKSKRKWVAGGLAAFASVALLTTGFATWIVGNNKLSSDHDGLTVNVDTARNESIELIAKLSDSSLKFAEKTTFGSPKFVRTDTTDGDLEITFSELKIVYGVESGFDSSLAACKLQFTLVEINGEAAETKNKVTYPKVAYPVETDIFGRSGDKTYIEAPEAVSLNNPSVGSASESITGGAKTYEFAQKTFKFRWGSAFENKSPCTYYNQKFDADGGPAKNAQNAAYVYDELTALQTNMSGSLKLRVEVAGYSAPASA